MLEGVRKTLRKTARPAAGRQAEAAMHDDLRRLAEVSPHLLADIGFEEQPGDASGGRVWTRGHLRVVLGA